MEEEDVLTHGNIRATNNRGVEEGVVAVTGANDDDSWVIAVQNAQTIGITTALAPMIQHGSRGASGNTLPQMPMGIPAGPPPGQTSGIGMALKHLGHVMYNPAMLEVDLSLQQDIQGNNTQQAAFRDFTVNYTQLQVYLAMLGDYKMVTMIPTLRAFYSLKLGTNTYQGKVLEFIGDQLATMEPTPICFPQTKAWQWFTNNVVSNQEEFQTFYDDLDNQGTWWKPTRPMSKMKAPFLLAIPNALMELLQDQGTPTTPADILTTISEVTAITHGGITKDQWHTVGDWCILAGQGSASNKSLLAFKVDLVAIDDEEFNTWVGQKLDVALGPRPLQIPPQAATTPQPPMTDYLQLSRLLGATVGQVIMQFTHALSPQAAPGVASLGQTASLETGKGFNRNQIAKLKDACGVNMAKDPHIWYIIQTMRGKAYNTYHDHLKKSIKSWCCTWHIERDK